MFFVFCLQPHLRVRKERALQLLSHLFSVCCLILFIYDSSAVHASTPTPSLPVFLTLGEGQIHCLDPTPSLASFPLYPQCRSDKLTVWTPSPPSFLFCFFVGGTLGVEQIQRFPHHCPPSLSTLSVGKINLLFGLHPHTSFWHSCLILLVLNKL